MAYTICNEQFKNKEEIGEYVRQITKSYRYGEPLSDEHEQFMLTLLAYRGERYFEKVGCGVDHVYIQDSPGSHGKIYPCFYIYRIDGSEADFSWRKCVDDIPSGRSKQPWTIKKFHEACRNEIQPAVRAVRGGTDWVYGDEIHHADISFIGLVNWFIRECSVDIEHIDYIGNGDCEDFTQFADRELATRWVEFHNRYAQLVPLNRELHRMEHSRRFT